MDTSKDYLDFIGSVKDRIRNAQYAALKAVNTELVGLYWDIGKLISEKQQELGWGKSVIVRMADDLRKEFPSQRGFSARNLRLMVMYYSEYEGDVFWQTLSAKLSFSHNMAIISKCKLMEERLFYLKMAIKFGWSFRVLEHQIDNKTYEKYLLNQTNYDELSNNEFDYQRSLAIKDHYTFDFLELSDKHSERELEEGLIRNMQEFLVELGGDFSFMGSQYKLTVGNQDFFIDLLLFHRRLQCLVVIELKSGVFKPEYKGKLEFYLNVLNDTHKLPHEKDAIGMIICKSTDRLVVEYSLLKTNNPIGIASYSTGPELPEYYEDHLPSVEKIRKGIDGLIG